MHYFEQEASAAAQAVPSPALASRSLPVNTPPPPVIAPPPPSFVSPLSTPSEAPLEKSGNGLGYRWRECEIEVIDELVARYEGCPRINWKEVAAELALRYPMDVNNLDLKRSASQCSACISNRRRGSRKEHALAPRPPTAAAPRHAFSTRVVETGGEGKKKRKRRKPELQKVELPSPTVPTDVAPPEAQVGRRPRAASTVAPPIMNSVALQHLHRLSPPPQSHPWTHRLSISTRLPPGPSLCVVDEALGSACSERSAQSSFSQLEDMLRGSSTGPGSNTSASATPTSTFGPFSASSDSSSFTATSSILTPHIHDLSIPCIDFFCPCSGEDDLSNTSAEMNSSVEEALEALQELSQPRRGTFLRQEGWSSVASGAGRKGAARRAVDEPFGADKFAGAPD